MNEYTVGEVARLAHVSVRTLHHYDEIGLLTPLGRSSAGYRQYSDADLARLQQIRYYRELDFGLDEIATILADRDAAADDHLRRQHRLLRERLARSQALLNAIEKEMEDREMGIALTPEEQFELFGTDQFQEYAEEAEQRWGDTDAWKQSRRRTATYTKDDWIQITAEADANIAAFAEALQAGVPATTAAAMDLAEEHRAHISGWFYDCGLELHRGLAELYVADPRFTASYDEIGAGLSQYVHDAMIANADRASG
ncbi:MAG: MerR family transcriptional regulator [Jatrophihabitantaceae bacterium]